MAIEPKTTREHILSLYGHVSGVKKNIAHNTKNGENLENEDLFNWNNNNNNQKPNFEEENIFVENNNNTDLYYETDLKSGKFLQKNNEKRLDFLNFFYADEKSKSHNRNSEHRKGFLVCFSSDLFVF